MKRIETPDMDLVKQAVKRKAKKDKTSIKKLLEMYQMKEDNYYKHISYIRDIVDYRYIVMYDKRINEMESDNKKLSGNV